MPVPRWRWARAVVRARPGAGAPPAEGDAWRAVVFAAGDPDKVAGGRTLLPDSGYTTWAGVRGALRRAIATTPAAVVKPASALAGYSGNPLAKKLGIKVSACVVLIGASARFDRTLGDLPPDVTLRT